MSEQNYDNRDQNENYSVISAILVVIITLLFMGLISHFCQAAIPTQNELDYLTSSPDGTMLISRNRNEKDNSSPGFWNHSAFKNKGHIVEAQADRGVIRTSFVGFLSRDYSRILALEPVNLSVGKQAANASETLVGLKFRKLSTLPGKDRPLVMETKGVNCESVIRYSERQASGERLRTLRIPDNGLQHPELFRRPLTLR